MAHQSYKEEISLYPEYFLVAGRTYSGRGSIGRYPASPALVKETKRSAKTKKAAKDERRQSVSQKITCKCGISKRPAFPE